MKAFHRTRGIVAPIRRDDVDTDAIVPQRWLVTTDRKGLGQGLFGGWRYDLHDLPRPGFVLNQPAYKDARIILAGRNYGCGSSREHAVWAHLDYGIEAVVAQSYGPIFYENCLKNGLLPVMLPESAIAQLMDQAQAAPGCQCEVNLDTLRVTGPDGRDYAFEMDAGRRRLLLEGTDDIAVTLKMTHEIGKFQECLRRTKPWLG
jgi:3-isopropylmalate/(R)-2-methylmalate dehydratase small subunit